MKQQKQRRNNKITINKVIVKIASLNDFVLLSNIFC